MAWCFLSGFSHAVAVSFGDHDDGVVQEVAYHGRVPSLIEERLYVPAHRLSLAGAARARRLQSGSLRAYVLFLVALVLALLLAARAGLRYQ